MASAVKTGNLYEGEVRKILEKNGWHVEGQHRKVSWIPDFKAPRQLNGKPKLRMIMVGRDIFGCDLIAKKDGEKTHWIQVSTRAQKASKVRQVMIYPWNLECDTVQLWLRESGLREYEVFQAPTFESVGRWNCNGDHFVEEMTAQL